MRGWRLAGCILLIASRVFCFSACGQASGANTQPIEYERVFWHLDLANAAVPQVRLPFVELYVQRQTVYGNIPDAEFWYILSLDRPHYRVRASALAIEQPGGWRLTLNDPSPKKTWPTWNDELDGPVFLYDPVGK